MAKKMLLIMRCPRNERQNRWIYFGYSIFFLQTWRDPIPPDGILSWTVTYALGAGVCLGARACGDFNTARSHLPPPDRPPRPSARGPWAHNKARMYGRKMPAEPFIPREAERY